MREVCTRAVNEKVDAIAFGDLFLADIRAYRENQLKDTGLEPLFPIWGIPTNKLAREMVASGLRAKLATVDTRQLPADFAGREYDAALIDSMPPTVDPCGEHGEFHTCVYAGPMFKDEIALKAGEVVQRDQFVYADFEAKQ
jgi:diphthamide synthase (EF-2-diphthine--ammonia ligase)